MDDHSGLLARSQQCRRLAGDVSDPAASESLRALAWELEEKAAASVTAQLRRVDVIGPDGVAAPIPYTVSRARSGWAVSHGSDRLVLRATLEEARHEALRLANLDVIERTPATNGSKPALVRDKVVHFQEVLVDTDRGGIGQLVFADGLLLALLVQLDERQLDQAGFWFLDVVFGAFAPDMHPAFPDLPAADRWIRARL
jgi:hypothetical protein